MLGIPGLHYLLVLPDAARVVLGACDDGIALVVECAREDFVFVTIQGLQLVARLSRPHLARLVAGSSDNLVTLRVELNF